MELEAIKDIFCPLAHLFMFHHCHYHICSLPVSFVEYYAILLLVFLDKHCSSSHTQGFKKKTKKKHSDTARTVIDSLGHSGTKLAIGRQITFCVLRPLILTKEFFYNMQFFSVAAKSGRKSHCVKLAYRASLTNAAINAIKLPINV